MRSPSAKSPPLALSTSFDPLSGMRSPYDRTPTLRAIERTLCRDRFAAGQRHRHKDEGRPARSEIDCQLTAESASDSVRSQINVPATTRTSTWRDRCREPRQLKSGTCVASEKDLRALSRTAEAPQPSRRRRVARAGRNAPDIEQPVRTFDTCDPDKGGRWSIAAAKWGGTTGLTPLVPNGDRRLFIAHAPRFGCRVSRAREG